MAAYWKPEISLAPSACKRWRVCTASPGFLLKNKAKLPPNKNKWNEEGDQAHAVAEAVLKGLPTPSSYKDKFGRNEKTIPKERIPEMVKHAKAFRKYCVEYDRPVEFHSELEIELFYHAGKKGFIDFCGLYPNRVRIVDYKYGVGHIVSAVDNDQMAIYARSTIEQHLMTDIFWTVEDDTLIELSIYQPRAVQGDIETTWKLTWQELLAYTDAISVDAKRIIAAQEKGLTLEFRPSDDTCHFCPGKTICQARLTQISEGFSGKLPLVADNQAVPETITLPDPDTLPMKTRLAICKHRKALTTWMDEVYKALYAPALNGDVPDGFKLVNGRGSRDWRDWPAVRDMLSLFLPDDTVEPRGKISPNQAETALRELDVGPDFIKSVKALAESFDGKLTLVPLSDPRPSVLADPSSVFKNLDADSLPESDEMSELF
jgi:hypothetical protein